MTGRRKSPLPPGLTFCVHYSAIISPAMPEHSSSSILARRGRNRSAIGGMVPDGTSVQAIPEAHRPPGCVHKTHNKSTATKSTHSLPPLLWPKPHPRPLSGSQRTAVAWIGESYWRLTPKLTSRNESCRERTSAGLATDLDKTIANGRAHNCHVIGRT